ncbi:hypothetical protein LVJ82_18370 [Vitreoscilla massiliensis]|uniref:Uncharacterized protein n=1 Tax=Vitreoscilla massiliensis TaxID=1689272 RepID=A0ABY4E7M3_9NEIS|nr:hypothetical protein [Vitreoscilla massiliensis]UOO89382.1 hypothetical protein LVJ82_18370 [Vitreoscilla massiliensis]
MTEHELQQTLWSIITTEPVILTDARSALQRYQAAGGTRQQAERLLHQMNTASHGYNENAIYNVLDMVVGSDAHKQRIWQ